MGSNGFAYGLLLALTASSAALAQPIAWEDPHHETWQAEPRAAKSFGRFGGCADDDPGIAVRECTRQLLAVLLPNSGSFQSDRAYRYTLRANAHAKRGNLSRALSDYNRANAAAYGEVFWIEAFRANAYFDAGDYQHALQSYNEAVDLEPANASLLNARARLLATAPDADVRNGPLAISDAQAAIALAPGNPEFLGTLAAAYAENGEFEEATLEQHKAIALLPEGNVNAANDYQSRLNLYLQELPYRAAREIE